MDRQALREALLKAYRAPTGFADISGWWRDPELLAALGPALAELHPTQGVTLVLGTESRGYLLGPLVATHLGVGFAEVKKEGADPEVRWPMWHRAARPDYVKRDLHLGVLRSVLTDRDRVLFVDDWVATGAQAETTQALVADAGAAWAGAAVLVEGCESGTRRQLNLRSILRQHDLPDST